jgi:hypothetical protein
MDPGFRRIARKPGAAGKKAFSREKAVDRGVAMLIRFWTGDKCAG